jgi:hypothetical protein
VELEEALHLETAASEELVRYFAENPDVIADTRVRHLTKQVEDAVRNTARVRARLEGLALRVQADAEAAAEAAAEALKAAEAEHRAQALALLAERQERAAEALEDWLVTVLGSGTVPIGFARNIDGWVRHLQQTVGVDLVTVALQRHNAREL